MMPQLHQFLPRSDLPAVAQRAKAEATKQSSFLLCGANGLLRFARNNDRV